MSANIDDDVSTRQSEPEQDSLDIFQSESIKEEANDSSKEVTFKESEEENAEKEEDEIQTPVAIDAENEITRTLNSDNDLEIINAKPRESIEINEKFFDDKLMPIRGLKELEDEVDAEMDEQEAKEERDREYARRRSRRSSMRQSIARAMMIQALLSSGEDVRPDALKEKRRVRKKKTRVIETTEEAAKREARETVCKLMRDAGEILLSKSETREPSIEDDFMGEMEEGESSYTSETVATVDRDTYYEMYETLTNEHKSVKLKNNFYHHRLAEYYRKKKMEHALKEEPEITQDSVQRYDKKLDKLTEFYEIYTRESARIEQDLNELVKSKEEQSSTYRDMFKKIMAKEKDTGIGLIVSKTGKVIPDKTVEQLIRRQTIESNKIADLRLKFIVLRNLIAEKQAELKTLDNIGNDLSLMDYEQLKIENRAHSDKLEERDAELVSLRIKCKNAIQIMAHIREKSAALDADIDDLKCEYDEIYEEYMNCREKLNYFKTAKDSIRSKTEKLKTESGLLTKGKLLMDMESSMEETQTFSDMLKNLKEEYQLRTSQIRTLRRNIVLEMSAIEQSKQQVPKQKTQTSSNTLHAGTSSLLKVKSQSRLKLIQKSLNKMLEVHLTSDNRKKLSMEVYNAVETDILRQGSRKLYKDLKK